jgi:hypothetical protein
MVNAVRGLAGGPQVEALLAHTTAYYHCGKQMV